MQQGSLDVDAVYWNVLHEDGADVELLDEETRAQMEPFTQIKMKQLKAYREQCAGKRTEMGRCQPFHMMRG
jgi:hypothetical protein